MPRFIIERAHPGGHDPIPGHVSGHLRHARSFSMGGKSFDVYLARDRSAVNRFARIAGIPASRIYG